jgi:phosphoglycolate phosphatase-like HAD superfamily hydrolase
VPVATALAVDLDGALGDTRPLWDAWLEDAARRLRTPDLVDLPADRGAAAAELDARLGNWPALLERFCEDHAPVYLRPNPAANAALRRLRAGGALVAAFTDGPEPLARVAVKHLGVWRSLDRLAFGTNSLERARFGADTQVVRTLDELLEAAA